jgi:dynein heavy chain 1
MTLNFRFQIQRDIATILSPFFVSDGLVKRCLEYAATLEHIMDFTRSVKSKNLLSNLIYSMFQEIEKV